MWKPDLWVSAYQVGQLVPAEGSVRVEAVEEGQHQEPYPGEEVPRAEWEDRLGQQLQEEERFPQVLGLAEACLVLAYRHQL